MNAADPQPVSPTPKIAPGFHASWADVDPAGWRWPHFTPKELACKCGGRFCRGEYFHDEEFLDGLEATRALVGPLRLTSARRCERHNAKVGGASRSQHKLRIAADIDLDGHNPVALARAALKAGFTGIGFGNGFLHVDQRDGRVAWNYSANAVAFWKRAFGFDPVAKLKAGWAL